MKIGGGRTASGWQRLAALGMVMGALLAACSPAGFNFGPGTTGGSRPDAGPQTMMSGRTIGSGPVKVALLLPLSGDAGLTSVGQSMANSAELAMSFVAANPNLGQNITIAIKDTGPSAGGAAQAASQALSEGVSLILGPLRADQVSAAGQVAKAAGVPVIGFSNNTGAASAGVYLLNVLPETEVKRSLGHAKKLGRKAVAGIFPTTSYGRIQEGAFRQVMSDLGMNIVASYSFTSEAEARNVVTQVLPLLKAGQVDTLFIPDRATAPSIAGLIAAGGIGAAQVQYVGSADWDGDAAISNTAALVGAIYPAVDPTGLHALTAEYQARYGATPHAFATLAYTATILANARTLSTSTPRYDRAVLTAPSGFNGRDGVFRFLPDGRSEFALVVRKVTPGGWAIAEAAPKRL